jgi:hypothetical protein
MARDSTGEWHDGGGDGTRMPRSVRRVLITVVATLVTGAVYLMAVRGKALLLDLANVFCL